MIEAKDGRILMHYYQDQLRFHHKGGKLFPLKMGIHAMDVLEQLWKLGWVHLDAHPENFLFDPEKGLKLLDYEYCVPYPIRPKSFEESWD